MSDLRPIQSVASDAHIQSLCNQSYSCEPVQPLLGMSLLVPTIYGTMQIDRGSRYPAMHA